MNEPKRFETRTFLVEREYWMRGNIYSKLLDGATGKMCCLGFVCEQIGLSPDVFRDQGSPDDLDEDMVELPAFLAEVTRHVAIDDDDGSEVTYSERKNSELADFAIVINDNPELSDEERERQLSELFAKHGFGMVFR